MHATDVNIFVFATPRIRPLIFLGAYPMAVCSTFQRDMLVAGLKRGPTLPENVAGQIIEICRLTLPDDHGDLFLQQRYAVCEHEIRLAFLASGALAQFSHLRGTEEESNSALRCQTRRERPI